jgi:hypothetical protein
MEPQNRIAAPIALRPAPPGFSPDSFFQGVHWHQRWEVFQGVFVPGRNDVGFLCEAVQLCQPTSMECACWTLARGTGVLALNVNGVVLGRSSH